MPSMLTPMDVPEGRLHNTSHAPEYDGSLLDNSADQSLQALKPTPLSTNKNLVLCALGDSHADGIAADLIGSQGP